MTIRKFSLTILFAFIALTATWGQSKLSPLMRQTIKMGNMDKSSVVDSTFSPVRKARAGKTYISAFVRYNDPSAIDSLEAAGAIIRTRTSSFVTADLPADAIDEISSIESIEYIEMGAPVTKKMDEAKKASDVNPMLQGTGLPQGFNGKDVIVGVIDNGFDYGHPDFYDSDKNGLRIKRVWNQILQGNYPSGFDYGDELTSENEILAQVTDDSSYGHGTHVLGIAAGADKTDGHDYAGTAQEADIVLVSLNDEEMIVGDNTAIIDGINYIFNYADEQGKPAVVNMSLGSFIGPRDGTSSFDQMCDEMQGPGRLLVGALGNDGGTTCHASLTFDEERSDTLKTFFEFAYSYPELSITEIWGEEGMELTLIPISMSTTNNRQITMLEPFTIRTGEMGSETEYVFENTEGSLSVASEINPLNGKPHFSLLAYFYGLTNQHIGFYVTSPTSGTVHVWTDNVYSRLGNYGTEGFLAGDDNYTAGEIGGTGKRIISVGGYVSRDHYEEYGIYHPSGETLGDLASFTSHGPTVDGRLKPEICAPSTYIVSSISTYDTSSPRAQKVTWNNKSYYFGYMQGTSMASPFVTGVMAAWLQAWPEMTPEDAKEIMKATAINDDFTGEVRETGDFSWGYGKLDAYEGVKLCLQKASGLNDKSVTASSPVIIRQDAGGLSLLFTTDLSDTYVTVTAIDGKTVSATRLGQVNAGNETCLSTDTCTPGIYLVTISSANETRHTDKVIIN